MYRFILFLVIFFSFTGFSQNNEIVTVIQKGHAEAVLAAEFSPDGSLLATGSRDKSVKIWEVSSGHEIKTLFGFDGTITDVDFSPDGKWLATASADQFAKVWDIHSGKVVWESENFGDVVSKVVFHPKNNWLAVSSYQRHITVFDLSTSDTVAHLKVRPDYGVDLTFSRNGELLAIGEDDRRASVYDTRSWQLIHSFKPDFGMCGGCGTEVKFSNDNRYLFKASDRSLAEVYDLQSGEKHLHIRDEIDDFVSLDLSPDGNSFLIASEDSVWIHRTSDGALINGFKKMTGQIDDACFSTEPNEILISGTDNQSIIYTFSGEEKKKFTGILNERDKGGIQYDPNNYWESHIARYIKYRNDLKLTSDGKYLIRGKVGRKARLWEVGSGKTKMEYIGHKQAVLTFELSKDEKQVITGSGDGKIILWDVESGQLIHDFGGHREPVFDIAWANSGKFFATTSWDGYVMIWDSDTGKRVQLINLENIAAYSLEFSPNDAYLVLGKLDKTLELWEIDSRRKVKEFIGHTDYVNQLVWSDNPNEFYSLGNEGYTISWNLSTGLINRKFKQSGPVRSLAIMNNDQLITAGADRVIRIWDRSNGQVISTLSGHQTEITSLNVNPTKGWLVSGDLDGVIKIWNLETEQLILEHIQMGDVDWMVMVPSGHFYATSGAMQNIHFVKGLKTYELDQFYEEFYNPELLKEIFEGTSRGGKRNMGGLLQQSPPPEVKFAQAPESANTEVELMLRIKNQGGGIKNLHLFHNGKRLNLKSIQLETLTKTEQQEIYRFSTKLVAGHNVFSAKAFSERNIASSMAEVSVFSTSTTPGSNCYVLAIGINTYKNPKLSLNYAKADASAFVESIEKYGSAIFSNVIVKELYDQEANRENILTAIDEVAEKAHLNDVVMVYYAGHGSVVDEQFYLIPTELTRLYDPKSMDKAISADLLQEKLRNIKSLKQVIIMDACQSGKSLEVLSQRGVMEEKAISQLSRSTGIHVLASAGSEQYAGEYPELGHGLFTFALLEVLSGKNEESGNDKKVTIYEIKSYLDERVPELSFKYKGTPQYPHSFSRGQDFPVGVVIIK